MTLTALTPAGQAELDAARLLLERMGITPDQLLQTAAPRPPAPTFAEYLPVVEAAVGPGTRRVYGSYWNRINDRWGQRAIDEPTPSEIKQLCQQVPGGPASACVGSRAWPPPRTWQRYAPGWHAR
jgi:integrase/recombinase XerC